ncbi:MLV-related proviral Env polyprotein-like [Chionomys nivalis]|uniref:MLV-related proviral Env polyprotein-like n=1 Tax=Chionomys nivalis TaxID=269649 RepID=UPI002593AA85|nr:MLV-related proviral Env polyprotein-like [Chionomys nivalis]
MGPGLKTFMFALVKAGPADVGVPERGTVLNGDGKKAAWDGPKYWGLRLYRTGYDPITLFSISRQIMSASPSQSIGPNTILGDQQSPSKSNPPPKPQPIPLVTASPSHKTTSSPPRSGPKTPSITMALQQPGTGDRLLKLVEGAFLTLNYSDPTRTQECWLCLVSKPPYYEVIAVSRNFSNHTSAPTSCTALSEHKLTLSEVSGRGLCIGKVPPSHQVLCNLTQEVWPGSHYLEAPNGTCWACSKGLTPCVSTSVLNVSSDYCVLIELWPKIIYHEPEYIYSHFEKIGEITRFRREPVSLTLALLLGGLTVGGMAAGIGTGVLEESISTLEKSLTSLSEVVLQNRRGLDILFLKEGGLCAALKEECCFYADQTGLVRDSMTKLRERLKQRQQLLEIGQGWFEGWFNRSPWFTTLVSSIMGPLMILLLILLFGPCILNKLVQFVKDRLSVIQTLVLTQQYHQLRQYDPEVPGS